jgi:serine/arginine repetitive matrix protein 1
LWSLIILGFLGEHAAPFCSELWRHLLSAQASPLGVPEDLIKDKLDEKSRKKEQIEQAQRALEKIKEF